MPSFDVVSELDHAELDNAINQTKKEVGTRFDFRGSDTEIERTDEGILIRSSDDEKVKATFRVLQERMLKRNVSLMVLDPEEIQPAGKSTSRQLIKLKEGIATEEGKKLVKLLKEAKVKVQASIQDEQLRVTGKNRDDLQEAMKLIRGADVPLPLQFKNFRD
ncbi:MAG: YajQ family cyclic di-GMP-binding protein [Polyangia bacterium]